MGYFRQSNFLAPPSEVSKMRTVVNGEWSILLKSTDSGISVLAKNNKYSEWLCTVSKMNPLFDFLFGSFTSRVERNKNKWQSIIDKKNSDYYFYQSMEKVF